MSKIQILPPELVNQIAAGEVVERPASVVKELVENAIDAGATKIDIQAKDGGRFIRVADNGGGMAEEDLRLAFRNHATSKITAPEDLFALYTLGFRGEALASISAIGKVVCYTRTKEAPSGLKAVVSSAGEATITPAGCSVGTVFEVSDLFYNVPARLKFMKRPQTELSHIQETLQMLALSHPEIAFELRLEEAQALKTRGSGELSHAIADVFSLNSQETLVAFEKTDAAQCWRIWGQTSTPNVSRGSKKWMMTFVNGRGVKCPILMKAVETAYNSLITPGKFPVSVLFVELPPDEVDVNVHPTKKEVKYHQANTLFSFVRSALAETFQTSQPYVPAPSTYSGRDFNSEQKPPYAGSGRFSQVASYTTAPKPYQAHQVRQAAIAFYQPEGSEEKYLPQPGASRVIGQLAKTYILVETPEGLLVVDQHIASERVQFERFLEQLERHEPVSQALLVPVVLPVSVLQQDNLLQNQSQFEALGFQFEVRDHQVHFHRIPILYNEKAFHQSLAQLLAQLEETGEVKLSSDDVIATMACHSAVRAGDHLNDEQMRLIIKQWEACSRLWTCPHGRPVSRLLSHAELMAFFDRPSLPIH